jgi:lipopolysaccharide transport system permease protein
MHPESSGPAVRGVAVAPASHSADVESHLTTVIAAQSLDPSHQHWDLVIEPHRSWWDLRLREIWQARDLIRMLVRRDLVAVYKQTILGPAWHLFQPVMTTITFSVVFGQLAGFPTDGAPIFLFYLTGAVIWSYFSACLAGTANTFVANAGLFGKIYFPRLTVPISVVIARLAAFGIQFALLLVCIGYYALTSSAIPVTRGIFLLPLLLAMLAGFGLGLGLLISALTTRYRDLQQLVGFGLQLLMYATPVIYPASFVRDPYRQYLAANPLTAMIEAFRWALLGAGSWSVPGLFYSAAATAAVLTAGLVLFNRTEATFMDTV